MKLVKFGTGKWTVYSMPDARGECPVLEMINELDEKRGNKVLSDLKHYVPHSTTADWIRVDFSKQLRDGIYEFRWPTKHGGTPRVFWFYDDGRLIVCTHGINKKGKMSDDEIVYALQRKSEYEAARDADLIESVHVDDFDIDELSE